MFEQYIYCSKMHTRWIAAPSLHHCQKLAQWAISGEAIEGPRAAFPPFLAAFRPSAAALLLAPDEDQPGNVTKYGPLGEFGGTSWETLAVKCFYILTTYHNIIQSNSRYPGFLYIITRLVTHENVYYSNPEPTRNLHVSMASCTWVRVHLSIPANTNQFSDLSERVDRRVRMPTAHLIADFLTQINLIQGTSKPMLKRGW